MFLRLFRKMMPREEGFIQHFAAHAKCIRAAADALMECMQADPKDQPAHFAKLSSIETQADGIARQTIFALHRAFITPFDRTDIHALTTALDDAVDLIEEVTQHAALYRMTDFGPRMRELAAMIQVAAGLLDEVMPLLDNTNLNVEKINGLCDRIGKVENDADHLLRLALSELIASNPDPIDFLGKKEVFERLEEVTDRCADVADVIEGILLDQV